MLTSTDVCMTQKLVIISGVILGGTIYCWVLPSFSRERVKRCAVDRPRHPESVLRADSLI